MEGKDPAKVIRDAIVKTLVFYYPFSGRLKEGPNGKLSVDCTGECVLFIEGDVDVTLQQFGDSPLPPFPCMDELLFDVKGYGGILNCPLFLIQVTRLKCGGFIFTIYHNRTMGNATKLLQFMKVVDEMARGALSPTISPVWERHLLNARTPPRVTYAHLEFDQEFMDMNADDIIQPNNMVNLSFFFGSNEISTLRKLIPLHYQCTTHIILTACLWRCHTKALQPDPDQHIRRICIVNTRYKFNPPLPLGYYGNSIAYPTTVTTTDKLCRSPLEYAIELVKLTKGKATEEYMKSKADFLVTNGRLGLPLNRWSFLLSNLT
ncbi:hypothetical protein V6Z11_A11G253900 [Gossypium hirsutum]